jgi:hypothetical protein
MKQSTCPTLLKLELVSRFISLTLASKNNAVRVIQQDACLKLNIHSRSHHSHSYYCNSSYHIVDVVETGRNDDVVKQSTRPTLLKLELVSISISLTSASKNNVVNITITDIASTCIFLRWNKYIARGRNNRITDVIRSPSTF